MNRILTLVVFYLCAISCGQTSSMTESKTRAQLHKEFVEVMLDSTISWKQVTDVVKPFVDSICVAAADEESINNRMFAQEWGYVTIGALSDKYIELKEAGKDVSADELSTILDRLADAMMLWFYSPDEPLPHLWRDHYYACHQHAEEPTNGFFHLMVILPTEDQPEPILRIFYPDSAEGAPMIVFSKYIEDGGIEEDEESRDLVFLENWSPKDSVQESYPMVATADAAVVEKMLQHDLAYLLFQSGTSANGDPGETEIARISLESFKKMWKERVH